jgi:hypothetical protein
MFLERLYVDDGYLVRSELAAPFRRCSIRIDVVRAAQQRARRKGRTAHRREGGSEAGGENDNTPAFAGVGSTKDFLVGEEGLEPSRPFGHRNLNPARLPIPPLARAARRG